MKYHFMLALFLAATISVFSQDDTRTFQVQHADLCVSPPYERIDTLEIVWSEELESFLVGSQFELKEPSDEALASKDAWVFRILEKTSDGSYYCYESVRTVPWFPTSEYKWNHRIVWIEREKRLPVPRLTMRTQGPSFQTE